MENLGCNPTKSYSVYPLIRGVSKVSSAIPTLLLCVEVSGNTYPNPTNPTFLIHSPVINRGKVWTQSSISNYSILFCTLPPPILK